MRKITALAATFVILFTACTIPSSVTAAIVEALADPVPTNWTVMYYVDADNDLEGYLLDDIQELINGIPKEDIVDVIALVDRIPGYSADSSILGENFEDTRLYRLDADGAERLSGGTKFPDIPESGTSAEYNMGDAATLELFIDYCKENYAATNYALIFTNHGGGVRSDSTGISVSRSGIASDVKEISEVPVKSVCYDETSGNDNLYTAEITNVLDGSHSVDLFVMDACLMGMLEVGYQYRPRITDEFSADYLVASAPTVWGYGYPYDKVFYRLRSPVSAETFGRYFVEEQRKDTTSKSDQVLALYNLDYADDVLDALDDVAFELADDTISILDTIRGQCNPYFNTSSYGEWISYPHFDLYDFAESTVGTVTASRRTELRNAIDDMVVASFGNSDYSNFQAGLNGLGFFFPEGDIGLSYDGGVTSHDMWELQGWYTGGSVASWGLTADFGDQYGYIEACHSDGDSNVDGWFELLQYKYNNPYSTAFHPGGAW